MEELNEEIQDDMQIYLNITWTDIGLALLGWIRNFLLMPLQWIRTQLPQGIAEDPTLENDNTSLD